MNSVMNCLSKLCMQDYKRKIIILQGSCNFTKKCNIITVTKKRSNCFHKQKPTLPSTTKQKTVKQSITMFFFLGEIQSEWRSPNTLSANKCKRFCSATRCWDPYGPCILQGPQASVQVQKEIVPLFSCTELRRLFFFSSQLTSNGIDTSWETTNVYLGKFNRPQFSKKVYLL